MAWQKITILLGGFVAGAAAVLLVLRGNSIEAPWRSNSGVASLQVEDDRRNGTRPGEVELQGPDKHRGVENGLRPGVRERSERRRAEAIAADTRLLLQAGFSQERIDLLRQHRNELRQQHGDTELEQRGALADPLSYAALVDEDILLRDEMNEDEYIRYRRALGKSTEIHVRQVLPGSYSEQAGIKPGDQVVRYNGKRVVDILELNALALSEVSAGSVLVDVLRDGQEFSFMLRKGPTGLLAITSPALPDGPLGIGSSAPTLPISP